MEYLNKTKGDLMKIKKKKKQKSLKTQMRDIFRWSLTFTKKVVLLVTILWSFQLIYSAIMILYAVKMNGDFSYLDSFITDNGETFRMIVGVNIISKTIENVFRYNEGGLFGKSITSTEEHTEPPIGDLIDESNTNVVG